VRAEAAADKAEEARSEQSKIADEMRHTLEELRQLGSASRREPEKN
jgi:hypothetical protein